MEGGRRAEEKRVESRALRGSEEERGRSGADIVVCHKTPQRLGFVCYSPASLLRPTLCQDDPGWQPLSDVPCSR